MCSFSVSCFFRELLHGVIHCGMRAKLGSAVPANQVSYQARFDAKYLAF